MNMKASTPTPLPPTPGRSFLMNFPECCPQLLPGTYPLTLCHAKIPRYSTVAGTCRMQNTVWGAGMCSSWGATASSRPLWEPVFLLEGMSEGGYRVGSNASLLPWLVNQAIFFF